METNYEKMSLRREHVENENLPKINIFYRDGLEHGAQQISYGIEEEGLPFRLIASAEPLESSLADTIRKGLGISIGLDRETVQIFNRQFKKQEAFMSYESPDDETLRIAGKNASRMLKGKPFVMEEQQ